MEIFLIHIHNRESKESMKRQKITFRSCHSLIPIYIRRVQWCVLVLQWQCWQPSASGSGNHDNGSGMWQGTQRVVTLAHFLNTVIRDTHRDRGITNGRHEFFTLTPVLLPLYCFLYIYIYVCTYFVCVCVCVYIYIYICIVYTYTCIYMHLLRKEISRTYKRCIF